jgi:hypothetical protein
MNEKEQAQWLFDNMLELIGDEDVARKAAMFVAEEVVQEIFDTGGNAARSQHWQQAYQMLLRNEIK